MKGLPKKIACIFMIAVLLVVTVSPAFAASKKSDALPIVYVIGKVDTIYKDKNDPNSKVIYPVSLENIDAKKFETLAETFAYAYSHTNNEKAWDDYCDAMYDIINDMFSELALNQNGVPKDNSGIIWNWKSNLKDTKENGVYGLYDYTFHYDWRLDMFSNAKLLDEYINAVLKVTGAKKCVLVSRCYGCNLVAAYFQKYGSSKIDTNILYCSTAMGSVVCGEMFSGKIKLNAEGVGQYVDELFGINPITAILGKMFTNSEFGVKLTSSFVNAIYAKICDRLMPKSLITSFASMPGYWSMVGTEYFNKARNYVFGKSGSEDRVTYAKMVSKITNYYVKVTKNVKQIFQDAYLNGTKYANITKYGNQIVPAIESCDYIGDGIVEVPSASLGATSVSRNETFSNDYINSALAFGSYKYISPGYNIDASTALFPDYTWFAEGVEHFDFPESVDRLILAIARYNGPGQMDVNTMSEFPQYAKYASEGNMMTWATDGYLSNSTDSLAKIINLILKVVSLIVSFFS